MKSELFVNGKSRVVEGHPMDRLLDILRDELGLIGTKEGCGEGECGACTVLMNGEPVLSCLIPRIQCEAATVETVEGLAAADARAFLDPIYSSGLYLALASAEMAADCVSQALDDDDCSAVTLGRFEPPLMAGVDVLRRVIHAFYDPGFSFGEFLRQHPAQREALIDCLVGDVVGKDLSAFNDALAQTTPSPPPLIGAT